MKNLNVTQTLKAKLDATIVGQCIDADNRRFFLLTEDVKIYEIQSNKRCVQQVELATNPGGSIGISRIRREDIIAIEYIVESGSICIVLKTGHFIRVGVSSFSPPSDCVYTHPKQLCSVKLSPDQDLIAVADIDNDISILTADFSVAYTSNALTNNDSAHKPVGVGWGSKETQFFGLDGRPSKEKVSKDQVVLTQDELTAIEKIESSDVYARFREGNTRNTTVDWRGDGQLLATFTFIPDSGKHYLKVWNRNLELQYMSEQLVTMERGLLSWVPNGQYVCTTQRRDNRINEIAMFEKNGMVHQRITLPTFIPHLYIKDLLWSPDSAVLAVVIAQFGVAQSQVRQRNMILLYTMQNFHYYLKYSSYLTLGGDGYSLRWDPNHNNILYIASESGRCLEYNCTQVVDYCQEDTTVAVVDANRILVTPFTLCNIPPPMSAITIELDTLVNRLVIHSKSIDQILFITLDNKIIYRSHYELEMQNQPVKIISKLANSSIKDYSQRLGVFRQVDFEQSHEYQNLTLLSQFSALATQKTEVGDEIVKLHIHDDPAKPTLKIEPLATFEGREVISVIQDSVVDDLDAISMILDDFSCIQLNRTSGEISSTFTLNNAGDRLYIKDSQYIECLNTSIILTLDLTLRVGSNVITTNCCTSFRTTPSFLIYTTIDHMIHIVPLDNLSSVTSHDEIGSWNQPIENGGILVVASESDSKVILQMPRGNLEILHPRIMVLLRIIDYLNSEEFVAALKLARRYRVDLNFLADYMLRVDAQAFYTEKLGKFANDLALCDPSLLNLFIAELTPDDTTCGRYKSSMNFLPKAATSRMRDGQPSSVMADKVNNICSTINLPPDHRYLQPSLLCLLKQEPRQSKEALQLIHKLPTKEDREAALKFMLYFISIEQLFTDAIATYNTDIAIMVAGVSSKDPKEYLALLDSFNELENVHLRCYKMDYHNKNYEKAFTNLLIYLQDAPNKQEIKAELLEMIVAKRIYRHAIKSCFDQFVNFVELCDSCSIDKTFEELSMEIWTLYGNYLLEKRYYLEGGLAYCKSMDRLKTDKKLESAIKCFLLANDWERCVAAIERHKLPETRRAEVLTNISNNLMLQGDFAEAILLSHVTKNDELAFDLVAKGKYYLAEMIVNDESRFRLRMEISSSVRSDFDSQLVSLDKELYVVKEQYARLEELLRSPPKPDHFDVENCYAADSLSTVDGSEATSVLSGSNARQRVARSGAPSIKTRASTKSNKSQAAKKKKKINLKVGSRHEDMALVLELKKFISKQKSTQECVRNLIAARIEFMNSTCLDKEHKLINDRLKTSHALARRILENLWPKEDYDDNVCSVYRRFGKVLSACENIDDVDLMILQRPELPEFCLLLEF